MSAPGTTAPAEDLAVEDLAVELGIRPLNARSVVLSALLGSHPPVLPVAALVSLASAFAIPAGTLRTALSRMAAAGEVTATDGRYRLAGRLIERQREQDAGRSALAAAWDGTWWTAISVGESPRPVADRRRLRAAMTGARMGEVRPGTWIRPANIAVRIDEPDTIVVRGSVAAGDPSPLVERLWDVGASEARARQLDDALGRWSVALEGGDDSMIAPSFCVFAACLQFLRTEPQLPIELSPSPAAHALRAAYDDAEPLLRNRLRAISRRALADAPSDPT